MRSPCSWVLVGLLAMHGLASTHHGPGPTSQPDAAQLHVEDQAGLSYVHAAEAAFAALASTSTTSAALPPPLCDEDCPSGLATMCLAVFTGAANRLPTYCGSRGDGISLAGGHAASSSRAAPEGRSWRSGNSGACEKAQQV